MLDLHSITLTDFRNYRSTHEFEFPVEDGLYYFTGKNLSNSAIGANGAGKSTLLDAIVWALYGRTTRGLKAGEVLTWGGSSGCAVTLSLTVGTERLQVRRTQKPNGLFLGDKIVDQAELEKHIRLNFEAFMYAVINSQFGASFLSISPAEKLSLFSEIMNLDYWLKKSDEAATQAKQIDVAIYTLTQVIASNNGKLEDVVSDIKKFELHSKAFHKDIAAKAALKKKELVRATSEAVSLDDQIKDLYSEGDRYLKKYEGRRDAVLTNLSRYAQEKATVEASINLLTEQIATYGSLGKTCHVCNQVVDKGHVDSKKDQLLRQLAIKEAEMPMIDSDLEDSRASLIKYKNKIDAIIDDLNAIKLQKAEAKALHDRVARLKTEYLAIRDTFNPFEGMIKDKFRRQLQLTKILADDIQGLQEIEAKHEAISFWIKGFKRIRLFIIEQAFRTLEIEVNNCLAQLGMPDWQITFDVERENKSGGVTKGFVVFVKSPANTEPVKWENWSGGETQRLQLAGDLGLANLIMQQAGLTNTIEFYDEPSTHLSPEGMMDLANMLHDRAVSEHKRIWIVDHASITNFGEFTGIITARKDSNGSSITYSGTK